MTTKSTGKKITKDTFPPNEGDTDVDDIPFVDGEAGGGSIDPPVDESSRDPEEETIIDYDDDIPTRPDDDAKTDPDTEKKPSDDDKIDRRDPVPDEEEPIVDEEEPIVDEEEPIVDEAPSTTEVFTSTSQRLLFNVSIEVKEHVTIPIGEILSDILSRKFNSLYDNYHDDSRVGKTLLNLRNDRQVPILNWKISGEPLRAASGEITNYPEVAIKLSEPLDTTQYPLNTSTFVSREMLSSVYEKLNFIPINDFLIPQLRPARNVVLGKSSRVIATLAELIPNIAGGSGTLGSSTDYTNYVSNNILENEYNFNTGMDINVDYSSYDNFVTFGSAQKRLDVFLAKLEQIESYVNEAPVYIENLNISASSADSGSYQTVFGLLEIDSNGSSSLSLTGSSAIYDAMYQTTSSMNDLVNTSINTSIKIQELIRGFDVYEKELWFKTGVEYSASDAAYTSPTLYYRSDYTYPKILGIPLATAHASSSTWYSEMSTIATEYDTDNPDILDKNVPNYLIEDDFSSDFLLFVQMVGHHFDNIKLYITNLQNLSSRYPKVDEELSGEMAKRVLESFGISAPSIASVEKLINYVTGNNTNDPYKDIANEYYKRYLHALPFLLKTKGTKQSVQSLLNVFGINPDLITVREGISNKTTSLEPKKVTTTEQDFALNINSGSYLTVPFSSSLRSPQTIQSRFSFIDNRTQPVFKFDNDYLIKAVYHPEGSTNTYYQNTGRLDLVKNYNATILYTFDGAGSYSSIDTNSFPGVAQEFTTPVGLTDAIVGAKLRLKRIGNDSRSIRVSIYSDGGLVPNTGVSELVGDIFGISNIVTTDYEPVTFRFTTPISVAASTQYWIVLSDTGSNGSNYLQIAGNTGSQYAGGRLALNTSRPPTSGWDSGPGAANDFWFEVYTEEMDQVSLVTSSYFDLFDNEFTSIQLKYDAAGAILDIRKIEGEETTFAQSLQETQASMSADWSSLNELYIGAPAVTWSADYTSASIDEFRMWGEPITQAKFIDFAENPGIYAGNSYTSSLEDLYVRLSFNLPTDANTTGSVPNTSPYVSKSAALDLTNISATEFVTGSSPLYNTTRYIRTVIQQSYGAGGFSETTDMVRIAPDPPATMSLSSTDTTVGIYEKFLSSSVSTNDLDISLSPMDAVDREIIRSFGNINIGQYLGNPLDTNRDSYSGLDDLEEVFVRELAPTINYNAFIKFFDKFLHLFYESIEQFLPARSRIRRGIVIRPNILNRTKVNNRENIRFSGETSRRTDNDEKDVIRTFDVPLSAPSGKPDEQLLSTQVYGLFGNKDSSISLDDWSGEVDATNLLSMTSSYDYYEGSNRIRDHEAFIYADTLGNTSSFGALEAVLPRTYKENITSTVWSSPIALGPYCDLFTIPPDSRFAYVRESSTYFNSPYGLYYIDERRYVPITSSYMLENGGPNDRGTWSSGTTYQRGDVVLQPVGLTASSGQTLSENGRQFQFVGAGYSANPSMVSTIPPEQDRNWSIVSRRSQIYQKLVRVINVTGSAYVSGSTDFIRTTVVEDLTQPWEGKIPIEYTPRHYIHYRDVTLGGLRRTYLGTLNTKATSADGGYPYEIFDIEGNELIVGTPEPCPDCD